MLLNISFDGFSNYEGSIEQYAEEFETAYSLGLEANGRTLTEMVSTLPKSKRNQIIKNDATAAAFEAGKRFTKKANNNNDSAKMKKARDAKKSRSEGGNISDEKNRQIKEKRKKQSGGNFSIDKSIDTSKLSNKQRRFIKMAKLFSKCFTRLNIRIVNSMPDENGEYHKENGSYDPVTNTIEININAGKAKVDGFFDYLLNETLSHETVHSIKAHSLSDYNALKSFLKKHVYTAVQWNNLVRMRLNEYRKKDPNYEYEDAEEEVVANGCQTMLNSPRVLYALIKDNLRLFEKIKFRVSAFFNELYRKLGDHVNYTVEARVVMSTSKGIQKKLQNAFIEAARNLNNETGNTTLSEENKKIRYSLSETLKSLGEYDSTRIRHIESSGKDRVARDYSEIMKFIKNARGKSSFERLHIGIINDATATLVKSKTGVDIKDYDFVLSSNFIFHIYDSHGNKTTESLRGQKEVNDYNIENIIEAVIAPDDVTLVSDSTGTALRFEKILDGRNVAITITSTKKSTLTLKSAWIINEKSGGRTPSANAKTFAGTPEANSRSSTTDSIPENSEKSNSFDKKTLEKYSNLEKDEIDGNDEIGYNRYNQTENIEGDWENGKERAEQKERSKTVHSGRNSSVSEVRGGTRTEDENRSGIQGKVGEEDGTYSGNRTYRGEINETEPFLEEDYIIPERNSELYQAQHELAEEYNIECRIVKESAWKKAGRKSPAMAGYGKVYIVESINSEIIKTLVPHESTHCIEQKSFKPYREFISRTADMLNVGSQEWVKLMKDIKEHTGIDVFYSEINDEDFMRFYDELNATVYGLAKGGIIDNSDYDYEQLPDAFYDFDAYISELDSIHEQFKASAKHDGENERFSLLEDTETLEKYTEEQYNNYGWARANEVLSVSENERLRSLFADAVSKQSNPPKTKSGEYMIAIGEDVDNKIAYMTGKIDNPVITRILVIDEYNETKLSDKRSEIYAFERRGIRQKTGELFTVYIRADVGAQYIRQRNGVQTNRYNDQLGAERGRGSRETSRIKEIRFDEDGNEVSRVYQKKSLLERDEITVRDMLATNLDELAVTKTEKKRIAEYRGRLDEQSKYLEEIDKLRDELWELSQHKSDRDIELKKKDIRTKIKALHYKITQLDSELLRLQNLRSVRNVVWEFVLGFTISVKYIIMVSYMMIKL